MDDGSQAKNRAGSAALSARLTAVAMAGLWAAWLAAGSTGLLAQPLQNALTWIALAVAIWLGWPRPEKGGEKADKSNFSERPTTHPRSVTGFSQIGLIPFFSAAAMVVGMLLLLAAGQPPVGTLAVTMILAALATCHRGLPSRAIWITALAVLVLGLFRLGCTSIPTVWWAADIVGRTEGRLVGWIAGEPLQIGATFGAVDFLVAMAVLYVGWLIATPRPRVIRATYAAVAILTAQFVYLTILVYHEELLSLLPAPVVPQISEINRVGVWTWGNAARTLLPWNLPLLAAVFHTLVAAAMFRWAPWLPVVAPDAEQRMPQTQEPLEGKAAAMDAMLQIGPILLAVAIPILTIASLGSSSLRGKTILAYDQGFLAWQQPAYDKDDPPADRMFGMLPMLVESLGGKLIRSSELSEQELGKADALLLLHPNHPWPQDRLQRIWQYVEGGGSLLLVAAPSVREGDLQSTFNDLLEPTAMAVRHDTVIVAARGWQPCAETMSHPATTGIGHQRNNFGLLHTSSIRVRWPAQPLLTGRFAWSRPGSEAVQSGNAQYRPGELLGDLVLAAEQPFGKGRIVVLGDTGPLIDDGGVSAYEFAGRLLGYLAGKAASPQAWWRQILAVLAIGALIGLLAWRIHPLRLAAAVIVLAATVLVCAATTQHAARLLPDGRAHSPNNVAYIDASHLEPYSSNAWDTFGLGHFARTLMRNGYLPLLLPEVTSERLQRAGLLISIAPARPWTPSERTDVRDFVSNGGTLILMVGAEEAATSHDLLADFGFRVPASPVAPAETSREPTPLGAYYSNYLDLDGYQPNMRFYAAWPVEGAADGTQVLKYGPSNEPLIIRRSLGAGTIVLIGDTYFAVNENMGPTTSDPTENPVFWRWLLSRATNQPEWLPPKPSSKDMSTPTGKETSKPSGKAEPIENETPIDPDSQRGKP